MLNVESVVLVAGWDWGHQRRRCRHRVLVSPTCPRPQLLASSSVSSVSVKMSRVSCLCRDVNGTSQNFTILQKAPISCLLTNRFLTELLKRQLALSTRRRSSSIMKFREVPLTALPRSRSLISIIKSRVKRLSSIHRSASGAGTRPETMVQQLGHYDALCRPASKCGNLRLLETQQLLAPAAAAANPP